MVAKISDRVSRNQFFHSVAGSFAHALPAVPAIPGGFQSLLQQPHRGCGNQKARFSIHADFRAAANIRYHCGSRAPHRFYQGKWKTFNARRHDEQMIFLPDILHLRHMTSKMQVADLQPGRQLFQILFARPGPIKIHLQRTLPPFGLGQNLKQQILAFRHRFQAAHASHFPHAIFLWPSWRPVGRHIKRIPNHLGIRQRFPDLAIQKLQIVARNTEHLPSGTIAQRHFCSTLVIGPINFRIALNYDRKRQTHAFAKLHPFQPVKVASLRNDNQIKISPQQPLEVRYFKTDALLQVSPQPHWPAEQGIRLNNDFYTALGQCQHLGRKTRPPNDRRDNLMSFLLQ
ncbi:MAG: hypothetical protein ABSF38_09545 [Verrucomicrobiota bacterium]